MPATAKPAIENSPWLAAESLTRHCTDMQTADVVRALLWHQLTRLRPEVVAPANVNREVSVAWFALDEWAGSSQAEYVLGELHEQLVGGEVAIADEWLVGLNGTKDIVSAIDALAKLQLGKKAWRQFLRSHGASGSPSPMNFSVNQGSSLPKEFAPLLPWIRASHEVVDDSGEPWVIAPGQRYWRRSDQRARRGAHYTPASLAAHIVKQTLAPTSNSRTTVCDPACGGGVFLVEAGRYLLRNSLQLGVHQNEKRSELLRECLFGVDVDPTAVETTRLSLWLLADEPDLPLNAFDENIRQGDALIGLDWQSEFGAVFKSSGFDAVVGNPPFLGGRKIRRAMGADYLRELTTRQFPGASGNADLCAFFFRRAGEILRPGGRFGLLATNTIAQGDTRETGLEPLLELGRITSAETDFPWPGEATLRASNVWFQRHDKNDTKRSDSIVTLDGVVVPAITSFLTPRLFDERQDCQPKRLPENCSLSFQGSIVLGMGFVLSSEKAQELIVADARNQKVIQPYLTGADLSGNVNQKSRRHVINFFDWPLDRESAPSDYAGPVATDYPLCYQHITEHVRPQRTRRNAAGEFVLRKPLPQRWWQYADKRPALYNAIAGLEQVICKTRHSPYCAFELVDLPPDGIVFQESLIVFASCDLGLFGLLSSGLHEVWARRFGSTLGVGLRYSSTDCFDTFAMPHSVASLREPAAKFRLARHRLMEHHNIGLTRAEKLWHSNSGNRSQDSDQDHEQLLESVYHSIASLDAATASAYGWDDLKLEREFQSTADGPRFALPPKIQIEILRRLLELNLNQESSSRKT